jgi:hypothetical protein
LFDFNAPQRFWIEIDLLIGSESAERRNRQASP